MSLLSSSLAFIHSGNLPSFIISNTHATAREPFFPGGSDSLHSLHRGHDSNRQWRTSRIQPFLTGQPSAVLPVTPSCHAGFNGGLCSSMASSPAFVLNT